MDNKKYISKRFLNCEKLVLASLCLSVRTSVWPSFRMKQLGSQWTDISDILIFEYFPKICRKISSVIKI
jgi:hypothetical protein